MIRFVSQRLVVMAALVFGLSLLTFLALHAIPGDPAQTALAQRGTSDEAIAALRSQLGLDRPLPTQYIEWLSHAIRLDFGNSMISGAPIGPEIARRLPRTIELAVGAVAIGALVGVPLGISTARRRGGRFDVIVTGGSVVGLSIPAFVSGTFLLLIFTTRLGWFPIGGYVSPLSAPFDHLQRVVLPALSLALGVIGLMSRITRSVMIDALHDDYVFMARAKGASERRVVYRHALPNALPPVFTVAGLAFGSLLGGTVVVESIFVWPGMSTYLIRSATDRDYPAALATVVVLGTLFIAMNIVIDVVNAALDPKRVRA